MSIAGDHVAIFRSQWADRLIDTADVLRLTNRGTISGSSLQYDGTPSIIYTARPCLIRPMTPGVPVSTDFGQQEVTFLDYAIYFAHDTVGIELDDRIVPQTVDYDPELVGATFTVTSAQFDSYRTKLMVTATLDLGSGEGQ